MLAASGGEADKSGKPGIIRLWNLPERREILDVPRHPLIVTALALSPDGRLLASASVVELDGRAGAIKLWDFAQKREVESFRPEAGLGCISDLAFSPDGTLLARASLNGTVTVCAAATGRAVHTFRGKQFYRVAFNRLGTRLAIGDLKGHLTLWSLEEGKELNRWEVHDGAITAVSFTGDGDRLVTASYKFAAAKGDLKIWDTAQERKALGLPGQLHLAISHDGRRLASLTSDVFGPGVVTLWDSTPWPSSP